MTRHRRVRGVALPPGVRYVGRGSRWGNPFRVGHLLVGDVVPNLHSGAVGEPLLEPVDAALAVALFRSVTGPHCLDGVALRDWLSPLQGAAGLACWCAADAPCHADVILEIFGSGRLDD